MAPKALLGRERNKLKYCKWAFYLQGDASRAQLTMKLVREAASAQKARARVPGGPRQPLVVEKVSKTKVEIAWPLPVSADSCCLLLKKALGGSWKDRVTAPAGVLGTDKEAATAEQGEVEAEAAGAPSVEAAYGAALEAALFDEPSTARGASSAAAGPVSPRPKSLGAVKESAATAEGRHGIALLAMKLETIATVYESRARDTFQELPQPYTVKWAAELGRGTYGQVYVATMQPATGFEGHESKRSFAIKMLRDEDAEWGAKYTKRDAVGAAEWEVRRHGALGLHPNLVALVDAGLFWEPKGRPGCNSYSPHMGLVFELYEIDVRQFLKKSQFTQSGMRHVLRSVLEGLGFIHSKGCIHCDLKPSNIFMRGGLYNRGGFEKDGLRTLQQLQDSDAVTPCAHNLKVFEYQVPSSFEVCGGSPCFDFEQSRLDARRVRAEAVRRKFSSNGIGSKKIFFEPRPFE